MLTFAGTSLQIIDILISLKKVQMAQGASGKSKDKGGSVEPAQEAKDQFINLSLTLRKLKKNLVIPQDAVPINLETREIRLKESKQGLKYLLISSRNIVYYGQLNSKGEPETSHGIFVYSDGSFYEGQIHNSKPEGQGKITNLDSSYSYVGSWKKGLPDGPGVETIGPNRYEGEFRLGKKDGQGALHYVDGSRYEGNFMDNVIEGKGRYYSKNNFWEGTWRNGYLDGPGRQIIAKSEITSQSDIEIALEKDDCSVYVGEFEKGEKSGMGSFKWNKNYEYEGHFEKGQLHGEGTFKFKGRVYAGVWSNGTEVRISQLRRGTPSIVFTGSIHSGNIILTNNESIDSNFLSIPSSVNTLPGAHKSTKTIPEATMHPAEQKRTNSTIFESKRQ